MAGALLDTHTLYWLLTAVDTLSEGSLVSIAESQIAGKLYVSAISAWELAIASRKPAHRDPPDFGVHAPLKWFSRALDSASAKLVPIRRAIAVEAANVPIVTGHRTRAIAF